MTTDPSIYEYDELVGEVRRVIGVHKTVKVYASVRDLDLLFQPGAQQPGGAGLREPRVIGYLKAGEKMLLTGLKADVAERDAVQICGPLSGWVETDKITK